MCKNEEGTYSPPCNYLSPTPSFVINYTPDRPRSLPRRGFCRVPIHPSPALGDDLFQATAWKEEIRLPGKNAPPHRYVHPQSSHSQRTESAPEQGDAQQRIYCAFLEAAAIFASLRRLRASGKASVSSILSHHLKLEA